MVEFDRGREPSGWKDHIRFSGKPYSTINGGFNIDKRFKSGFNRVVEFDRGQK